MRYLKISALTLVLVLATCTGAAFSATTSADNGNGLNASIKSISEATDASAALTSYAYGLAANSNSTSLREAYIRKMIDLGQPGLAYEQARELVGLNKDSGLGWAVIGFADIERSKIDEAASALARAAFEAPDDPFVQSTCGQLAAWYDSDPNMPGATTITATLVASIRGAVGQAAPFTDGYKAFQEAATQAGQPAAGAGVSVPLTPPDNTAIPNESTNAPPIIGPQDEPVTTVLADVPFDEGSLGSPVDVFASTNDFPFAEGVYYPDDWSYYDTYWPGSCWPYGYYGYWGWPYGYYNNWCWSGPFFGCGFFSSSFCPGVFFDRDDFGFGGRYFHDGHFHNNSIGAFHVSNHAGGAVLTGGVNGRLGTSGLTVARNGVRTAGVTGATWSGGAGRNFAVARPFGSSSGNVRALGGVSAVGRTSVARPGVTGIGGGRAWTGNMPVATPYVRSLGGGARGIAPAIPGRSWTAGGFNPARGSRPIPIRPSPPVSVAGGRTFTSAATPHILVPSGGGTRSWTGSRVAVGPSVSTPHYSAPTVSHYSAPHFSAPHFAAPHFTAPHFSAPHYSAPHYSAPHYSAPSHFSGGGGGFRGGGGGFHGGGGGHR